jgi:hypothetical protein
MAEDDDRFENPSNEVDRRIEKIILQSLTPPQSFVEKFGNICNVNRAIFGEPGSKEVRQVVNRRYKLSQKRKLQFDKFKKHCERFGVDCPDTLEECTGQTVVQSYSYQNNDTNNSKQNMESPNRFGNMKVAASPLLLAAGEEGIGK